MRIRWREFELPNRVSAEKETYTDFYGKFIAEPFERGFGITIGNGLRRIYAFIDRRMCRDIGQN